MRTLPGILLLLFMSAGALHAQTDTTYARARFPGGDRAFALFWDRHFKISLKDRFNPPEGEGIIRFDVGIDGSISNITVTQSLTPELDQSAIETVRKMPNWTPGTRNGIPVESTIEYTYFILIDKNGARPVDWLSKEEQAKKQGLYMDLWAGLTIQTGDFSQYFNPVAPSLGIEFSYRRGPWSVGTGWDILGISNIKQPFVLDQVEINEGMRASPIYLYFPIRYRFETASKWTFAPMVAPTINHLEINAKGSQSNRETVASIDYFSISAGIHVGKRVFIREYFNPVKQKLRYESSYASARLMVNLRNLKQKSSTQIQGPAITLGFSFSGWLQGGKQVAK